MKSTGNSNLNLGNQVYTCVKKAIPTVEWNGYFLIPDDGDDSITGPIASASRIGFRKRIY